MCASDNITLNPRRTTTTAETQLTKDTTRLTLERRGHVRLSGLSSPVKGGLLHYERMSSPDQISLSLCLSLSLSLLFVQRSRGLSSGLFFFKSPGSKAHVCFKNDNLFCLSFVFLLYMLDTGFYRWITPILVDGLTESCNSSRTNECSKCGKNHWVLFKAKDWKKKKM